ncbi:MAG: hypothetical protein ACI87A_000289 [Planctomycetota bacterium]|jgi:hypothetical protein
MAVIDSMQVRQDQVQRALELLTNIPEVESDVWLVEARQFPTKLRETHGGTKRTTVAMSCYRVISN